MSMRVRERLSDTLLRMGAEAALDRQVMERSVAADPTARGYPGAIAALRTAQLFDSALLWLGWRLQPRNLAPH